MAKFQSEEERLYYERTRKPIIPMPTTRRGRFGCGAALLAWFFLLMLPCALFSLAFNGDITFQHADVPEPESHPFLQISLVMDADNRGFSVTRSWVHSQAPQALCMETAVNYLLWETRNQSDPNIVFCDCYERDTQESMWNLETTVANACSLP